MKKALSVLLAVIMIVSCFALTFGVFAEETTAQSACGVCACGEDCKPVDGKCHCCINCAFLDKRYLTHCVTVDEDGNIVTEAKRCCDKCTGIWPCNCGHDCCNPDEEIRDDVNNEPIFSDSQQNTITRILKNLIKRFSDAFDNIFNAIFEFLRIGEVFPDIKI
ncbi:MAG: hypothetical protein NC110_07660 [Ruminococcus sp.]|nr:hypothetical protein [Ruminococcus sp.]